MQAIDSYNLKQLLDIFLILQMPDLDTMNLHKTAKNVDPVQKPKSNCL
jgi:hypothetical protein